MKLLVPLLAANAVAMMAAALGLWSFTALPPALVAHIALALGIMPLILAAMAYFVPVLTRSGAAPLSVDGLALLAWLGGLSLVAGLAQRNEALGVALIIVAALLAAKAAASLLLWSLLRARRGLGAPHAGLAWYVAALGFLLAALFVVPLLWLWPEQRQALRLVHLHANLLGFVGLTAIGTLQVLLPTAAGQMDATTASRLRRDLKFAVVGSALLALGAGASTLLAAAGAALFMLPLVRMGKRWTEVHAAHLSRLHGAATVLALASVGLILLLLTGFGHSQGGPLRGSDALAGFVFAFLLPLVSGAVMQLLPVWLRPGRQGPWHDDLRHALGRYGSVHALLFVAAGLAVTLGHGAGLWLAGAGLALLLLRLALALPYMTKP